MKLTITMTMTDNETRLDLGEGLGTMRLTTNLEQPVPANDVRLATAAHALIGAGDVPANADGVIILGVPDSVDGVKVQRFFEQLIADGSATASGTTLQKLLETQMRVLVRMGIQLQAAAPAKKRPAKARHRFDKTLKTHAFYVKRGGSEATVYWTAAKEMTIAPGAKLVREPLLNRDGSQSYGTKYGDKLRADNADKIADFTTTAPVTLRSVNEVGLFLYYGDTNGWLELVDADGKTLDELTRVD